MSLAVRLETEFYRVLMGYSGFGLEVRLAPNVVTQHRVRHQSATLSSTLHLNLSKRTRIAQDALCRKQVPRVVLDGDNALAGLRTKNPVA